MLALRGCLTFAELWYKSLSDDVSTGNWKFILQHTSTRNASVHRFCLKRDIVLWSQM